MVIQSPFGFFFHLVNLLLFGFLTPNLTVGRFESSALYFFIQIYIYIYIQGFHFLFVGVGCTFIFLIFDNY